MKILLQGVTFIYGIGTCKEAANFLNKKKLGCEESVENFQNYFTTSPKVCL